LVPPPPSQAPIARWLGWQPKASKLTPDLQRIEAIRELTNGKAVQTEVLNPTVLLITSNMNTPELAQKVASSVFEVYKEEFERMQKDTADLVGVFKHQLDGLQKKIEDADAELQAFYKSNVNLPAPGTPQLALPPKNSDTPSSAAAHGDNPGKNPKGETFTPAPENVSPLLKLRQDIVQLKIDLIKIESKENKDSYAYRNAEKQLLADQALLVEEENKLGVQIAAADREQSLKWARDTYRNQFNTALSDFTRAEQNMKIRQQVSGAVTAQDEATFDPQPIFPKRTMLLIASAFIGLVLGLGLAYLAHVLDSTYHLPEDFSADTGLPVLAAIPYDATQVGGAEAASF
jgi:uncharacterized protein involved in exopolysaccharide biosynthesis